MDDGGVEIPAYNKPDAASFNLFGNSAAFNKDNNAWNFSGIDEGTYNAATKIRSDLLKSLGVGSGGQDDPYTQTLMSEILRTSQPGLENALIGRGLGGSSVYKDALTDLFSKAGTQAVLGSQQYKQGNYNMLSDFLNNQFSQGANLLNMAQGNDLAQQGLAQQLYQAQLPYQATYDQGFGWNDIAQIASIAAAPFTGGASLMAMPAASAAGGMGSMIPTAASNPMMGVFSGAKAGGAF